MTLMLVPRSIFVSLDMLKKTWFWGPSLSAPIPNFRASATSKHHRQNHINCRSVSRCLCLEETERQKPLPQANFTEKMETAVSFSSSNQIRAENYVSRLWKDIAFLLSRWNGLQMAVQNKWGGRDSLQKSHQLASDIFSWMAQSRGPLCVEDLENFLHESLLLSFNTEIEDGSIEEVAEQLMIMHDEYLHRSN